MEHTETSTWTAAARWARQGRGHRAAPADAGQALRRWAPWLLAGLTFLALMFSFLSVLQQAVERGERHRQLAAQQASAQLLCRSEATLARRRACAVQLDTAGALASLR